MKALLSVCLALTLTFIVQGCRQGMDLNPQDYFSGQQLILAKAIEHGEVDEVKNSRQKWISIGLDSRI